MVCRSRVSLIDDDLPRLDEARICGVCVSLEQERQGLQHPQPDLLDTVAAALLQDPPAAGDPGVSAQSGQRGTVEGGAVLTRRGARVELASAACFVVAALAAVALAVVYWEGGQPQAEGVLLAASLGGIGVGIVLWAKHFMPDDEVAEERHPMASAEEDVAAFTADYEAGGSTLRSRRILVATAGGACAALGVALLSAARAGIATRVASNRAEIAMPNETRIERSPAIHANARSVATGETSSSAPVSSLSGCGVSRWKWSQGGVRGSRLAASA